MSVLEIEQLQAQVAKLAADKRSLLAALEQARDALDSSNCPNGSRYRCPFQSCKRCRGLEAIRVARGEPAA